MTARSKFFDDDIVDRTLLSARPPLQKDGFVRIQKFFVRSEIKIAIGLVLASIVIGYFAGNIFGSKDLKPIKASTSTSENVDMAPSTTLVAITKIKIYVTGEVNSPGVYEIENNSRLGDVLAVAGNTTANADLSSCNLASFLSDGMKIAIPSKGQNTSAICGANVQASPSNVEPGLNVSSSSATATPGSTLVNLNTATQSELESLPGVGPSYALGIIDFRSKNGGFKSVADLQKVKGIGEKRYQDLKDLVTT